MISHLMLDIDGVVITGRPSDGKHWKTDLEVDLGVSVSDLHHAFFEPYWADIITGKRTMRPTLVSVLEKIAPHLTADRLIEYWFRQDARCDGAVSRDAQRLRSEGMVVCFATNQDALRAQFLWSGLGLCEHADHMFSSSDLGAAKPDIAFFEAITARTNTSAEAHLLIDDSAANAHAARKAGWHAHHWTGAGDQYAVVQAARAS